MLHRGLSTKWTRLAAITALAMGPACDGEDESNSSRRPLLEDEDAAQAGRPPTPVTGMTTYDRSASVPGFAVEISLGGVTGEDVVLDWYGTGFTGDVTIYRSADPHALLDIALDEPLPAGVTATDVSGVTSWTDAGAASRTVQTPHYYYRVGRHTVGTGDGGGNDGNGGAAYLRADGYSPWGQTVNEEAMDMEFGAGSWSDLRYETVDVDSLFSSQYEFIYLEGGDSNANELETFITNNIASIEAWVDNGGALFLNAAPNEGGSQAWGFGGVTLHYYDFPTDPGHAVDASHTIWNGPFLPTATSFTGGYYAHATVSGPGLVPHILDADGGNPNLAELDWGLGRVMFGGLTTSNFWSPSNEALNLRANIIDYLAEGTTAVDELQLSTMVMKTTTVTAPGFNRFGLCMLDGPATASEAHAELGASTVGIHQWNADTQSYMSWTPGGGTPDFPLLYGSAVVAQLDGSGGGYRSIVGVVPTTEALAVTGEPGYNWATLPVFYDGPTSTDWWLTHAGYWGIGVRHNDTQTAQYDWMDPGYDPFEMEPCGAYDMYLPNNACAGNEDCNEGQFCYFVEPAACGDVAAGLCLPEPLGCEGAPESEVCGCDGETYANECTAQAAGVAMRGAGECGAVCGDGNVDPNEECDGANLAGATCALQGFSGGTLGCTDDCSFDTAACTNAPACTEDDIGSATGNAVISGTTVGEDEDLVQGCAGGGVDRVIHFVAPGNGTYEFNMIGSPYDTALSLHATCGGAAITCNDDWYGLQSRVELAMTAGQEILIAVSGYAGQTGSFTLNIVPMAPPPQPICGDGNIDAGEQCDGGNLGEASCQSQGFTGGTLGCTGACTFDTAACTNGGGGGGGACEGGQDPVALALAACQAEYSNCDIVDGGVVGHNGVGTGSNCGTPAHPWRFYCTETSDASNYNCSACTVGEILGAHDPCSCDPNTSPVLGSFCDAGAPPEAETCEGGTDALTGIDWVVCTADANEAWVSHADPGGGQLHAQQICNSLGYSTLGSFGGTCGNVCGYCEGATSCESHGSQTYDGAGACGNDGAGQILCNTVQWQCLNQIAA